MTVAEKLHMVKPSAVDDRDTLHTLRLDILPIEHPVLRRARMIKNARLDSVLEMFRDREIGSGQIEIEKLPQELGLSLQPGDFNLIRKLALMPSYDVYSLRVALRELGIEVNDQEALRLSPVKTQQLSAYMRNFTRPLMEQIYGGEGIKIDSFEGVVSLFRDPDVARARHKLTVMAAKLGIDIARIPNFLEDYADIFLSLSYYKECLDYVTPLIYEFFDSMNDLKKSLQMRNNTSLMTACGEIQGTFTDVLTTVTGRLESFDRHTKDMWSDLSAERFRKIEVIIKSFHTMMGGILCALTVKMDGWVFLFPTRNAGAPGRRADFILNDLRYGLKRIREIEKTASAQSALGAA